MIRPLSTLFDPRGGLFALLETQILAAGVNDRRQASQSCFRARAGGVQPDGLSDSGHIINAIGTRLRCSARPALNLHLLQVSDLVERQRWPINILRYSYMGYSDVPSFWDHPTIC